MPHANGNWKDVVIDSAIAGGSAAVGVMAGMAVGAVRADPIGFVYALVVAFAVAFFVGLQAARGRKEEPT